MQVMIYADLKIRDLCIINLIPSGVDLFASSQGGDVFRNTTSTVLRVPTFEDYLYKDVTGREYYQPGSDQVTVPWRGVSLDLREKLAHLNERVMKDLRDGIIGTAYRLDQAGVDISSLGLPINDILDFLTLYNIDRAIVADIDLWVSLINEPVNVETNLIGNPSLSNPNYKLYLTVGEPILVSGPSGKHKWVSKTDLSYIDTGVGGDKFFDALGITNYTMDDLKIAPKSLDELVGNYSRFNYLKYII